MSKELCCMYGVEVCLHKFEFKGGGGWICFKIYRDVNVGQHQPLNESRTNMYMLS